MEMSSSTRTPRSDPTSSFGSSFSSPSKNKIPTVLQCGVSTEVGGSLYTRSWSPRSPPVALLCHKRRPTGSHHLAGVVLLSAILVAWTATVADMVNRIVLASLVTEPIMETPHLAFPIEDIGAGLVVTDPVQIIEKERAQLQRRVLHDLFQDTPGVPLQSLGERLCQIWCYRDSASRFSVCNRSTNRFSSAQVCEKRCVLSERPDDGCLEKPFFTACGRHVCLGANEVRPSGSMGE
ncbi:hypothetical protein MRX96_059921 [Rhipicephalus microplus]